MYKYHLTALLSAFLLFQVQPLLGKIMLPSFGGSPEVWTSCMLAYQVLLMLGYWFVHVWYRLKPVYLVLLVLAPVWSFALLGCVDESFSAAPILDVLLRIVTAAGLPILLLSTTAPLLQRWLAADDRGQKVYRIYAWSNFGSFLGLLSYPFIVERFLSSDQQLTLWKFAFVCLVLLLFSCYRSRCPSTRVENSSLKIDSLFWCLAWSACGVMLLLSITNYLCRELMALPLLWVLPLAIYLLSFVLAFADRGFYRREAWLVVYALSFTCLCLEKIALVAISTEVHMILYLIALLAGCMLCHGQLHNLRPKTDQLSSYYLILAIGGALGGILISLIAPLVFNSYRETPLSLQLVCILLIMFHLSNSQALKRLGSWRQPLLGGAAILCFACSFAYILAFDTFEQVIIRKRNFFGVTTVIEETSTHSGEQIRILVSGATKHGVELLSNPYQPASYFGPDSGIEKVMSTLSAPRRVGVVGLGIGTVLAYARPGDSFRFYEIDPIVIQFAHEYFSFLDIHKGQIALDIIEGDGRLSLRAEKPQGFDLLILDAFSGSSIPAHLITLEALELYVSHLKQDGILVFNVSNDRVNLSQMLFRLAEELKLSAILLQHEGSPMSFTFPNMYVLISRQASTLKQPQFSSGISSFSTKAAPLWTDNYSPLISVLR